MKARHRTSTRTACWSTWRISLNLGHKETIEKSAVDLEALNDERSERLTRVKYVEKEKESLEAKKREAEAFLKNETVLQSSSRLSTRSPVRVQPKRSPGTPKRL